MKCLFFHQWTEHDYFDSKGCPYLEDVIKSILPMADKIIEIHLLQKNSSDNIGVILKELLQPKYTHVQLVIVTHHLGVGTLHDTNQWMKAFLKETITKEAKIFIHLGQGDIVTQQMMAHYCTQHYFPQIIFLTGIGFRKEGTSFYEIPVNQYTEGGSSLS